jgi:hypothetical protein
LIVAIPVALTVALTITLIVPAAIGGERLSPIQPHKHSTQGAGGCRFQNAPSGNRRGKPLGELVK